MPGGTAIHNQQRVETWPDKVLQAFVGSWPWRDLHLKAPPIAAARLALIRPFHTSPPPRPVTLPPARLFFPSTCPSPPPCPAAGETFSSSPRTASLIAGELPVALCGSDISRFRPAHLILSTSLLGPLASTFYRLYPFRCHCRLTIQPTSERCQVRLHLRLSSHPVMASACDPSCGFSPSASTSPSVAPRARLTKPQKGSAPHRVSLIPVPLRQNRFSADHSNARVLRIQALTDSTSTLPRSHSASPARNPSRTQPVHLDSSHHDSSSQRSGSFTSDGPNSLNSSLDALGPEAHHEPAVTRHQPNLLRKRQHTFATPASRGSSRFREDLHDFETYRPDLRSNSTRDDDIATLEQPVEHSTEPILLSNTRSRLPGEHDGTPITATSDVQIPQPSQTTALSHTPLHDPLDIEAPQVMSPGLPDEQSIVRCPSPGLHHQPLPPLPPIVEQESRESLFQMPTYSSERLADRIPPLPSTSFLHSWSSASNASLSQNQGVSTLPLAGTLAAQEERIEPNGILPPSMAAVSSLPVLNPLVPVLQPADENQILNPEKKPRVSALQPRSPANERVSWLTASQYNNAAPLGTFAEPLKAATAQKKGPMAGTGHEGYGKYSKRARDSRGLAVDNVRGVPGAHEDMSIRQKGAPLDDLSHRRLSPVVLRGNGSVSDHSSLTDYMPFTSSSNSPMTSGTSATSTDPAFPHQPSRMIIAVRKAQNKQGRNYAVSGVTSLSTGLIESPPPHMPGLVEQPRNDQLHAPVETLAPAEAIVPAVTSRSSTPFEMIRVTDLAAPSSPAPLRKSNTRIWYIFPKATRKLQRVRRRGVFSRIRVFFTKRKISTPVGYSRPRTPARWDSNRILSAHFQSLEILRDIGMTDRPNPASSTSPVTTHRDLNLPAPPQPDARSLQLEPRPLTQSEPELQELPATPNSPVVAKSFDAPRGEEAIQEQAVELDSTSNYEDGSGAVSSEDEEFPVHAFPRPLQGHLPTAFLETLPEEEHTAVEEGFPTALPDEASETADQGSTWFAFGEGPGDRSSYSSSSQGSLFPAVAPEVETATALSISSSMANLVDSSEGTISRSNSRMEREKKKAIEQMTMIGSARSKTVFPNLATMATVALPRSVTTVIAEAAETGLLTPNSRPVSTPTPRTSRLPRRSAKMLFTQVTSPGPAATQASDQAIRVDSPIGPDSQEPSDGTRALTERDTLAKLEGKHSRPSEYITAAKPDPLAVANLRFGALITSKWLSFGRVLLSPVTFNPERPTENRVLVIDGLGKGMRLASAALADL